MYEKWRKMRTKERSRVRITFARLRYRDRGLSRPMKIKATVRRPAKKERTFSVKLRCIGRVVRATFSSDRKRKDGKRQKPYDFVNGSPEAATEFATRSAHARVVL